MHILQTDRLILRNWQESDKDLFREINADPKVMEFFPFRRSHAEADALLKKLTGMISDTGYGFYAIERRDTGQPIGFCGLALTQLEPHLPDGTVEIGWRLATQFWGHGFVTEAANALIDFGFIEKALPEIVSFAVIGNHRSTAVMTRLGMLHDPSRDFTHPRVPDSHPHLQHHVLYAISRQQWAAQRGVRSDDLFTAF